MTDRITPQVPIGHSNCLLILCYGDTSLHASEREQHVVQYHAGYLP